MQKIANLTCTCRLTVAGLFFVFVVNRAGVRRATYLCLDSTKNFDKNWDINVSLPRAYTQGIKQSVLSVVALTKIARSPDLETQNTTNLQKQAKNWLHYALNHWARSTSVTNTVRFVSHAYRLQGMCFLLMHTIVQCNV